MSSNPFGIMFHVTGTAATQNSRVAAPADGAAASAATPVDQKGRERDRQPHWTVMVPCMNGWIMQ